ncbi:MAG: sugar ABC transporter substrate-binding protein [Methanomassiliicoccales archaeon]|nr:sugar ABC transporter substrate-binding protein [Methanomassiliicoccales archaeon]
MRCCLFGVCLWLSVVFLSVGTMGQELRAYAGTTLRVLLKAGYETAGIEKFVHIFEEATGINVEYEVYDEPTMRQKFILDFISGTGAYDVVAVQYWYFPEYSRMGCLEPLNDLDVGFNPYGFKWEAVPKGARDLYTAGEKVYAVPVSLTGAGVLIYRKDILDKWNLTPPSTVYDVVAIAKFLKEREPDLYPFCGRGSASFASFGTSAGWAWAYGARVLTNGTVTVDTPEMRAAMEDLVTLMRDYGPPGQATIGWEVMSELYRAGKVVMTFDMAGFPSVFADPTVSQVAGKIGVSLLTGPAGNYAQWLYSEGLAISRLSKNKEAARLFIQWRASLETCMRELEAGIRIDFPNMDVYKTDLYKEIVELRGLGFWAELLPQSLALTDGRYWPFVPEFVQIAEAFQEEISLAIAGRQTVAEALRNAQAKIENIIRR